MDKKELVEIWTIKESPFEKRLWFSDTLPNTTIGKPKVYGFEAKYYNLGAKLKVTAKAEIL